MLASTHLRLEINGGPAEVSDLSVWKAGLVANKSTWVLTDRGSELVAVWDVIGRNHGKEFGELKDVLRKAWETKTGLQSVPDFLPTLKYNPEDVMNEVITWMEEELSLSEIEDNLAFLYEIKEDILTKVLNPQYWIDKYLSQSNLQEFLLMIVDSEECSSSSSIKFLMKQIISERDIKNLSRRIFPDIEDISTWLYGFDEQPSSTIICENFEKLLGYLKKSLDEAKLAQLESDGPLLGSARSCHFSSIPMATNVSLAVHSLRTHCQGTYDEILVMILSFPFQNSNTGDTITLNPLSISDLQLFHEKFTEGKEKYDTAVAAGLGSLRLQSFLLFLAVSNYKKRKEQQLKTHLKKISEFINQFGPSLEAKLKDELHSYLRGSCSLAQFSQSLCCLYSSGQLPLSHELKPPPGKSVSLLQVLNTEKSGIQSTSAIPVVLENNREAHALFKTLGLTKYYHEKLGLHDALCIRPESLRMSLNLEFPTEPTQLPFLIFQKLMSFDYLCRSDLMNTNQSKEKSNRIHPLDSLLALIICSDHFLKQDLFTRIVKCQLAVPFILPDPFTGELVLPLWAMRSITREWKCVQTVLGENKVIEKTSSVIKYPMPIVSFLRLGKSQKRGQSKSKIVNKIISDFDHFFHRDLSGGSYKHVLGDGLVDMCWYHPAGKKGSDVFPDAVTFLNLHGDAREHPRQSRFLSQISSMCFVLLTESDLELSKNTLETLEHFSSTAGGLVLLQDVNEVPEMLTSNKSLLAAQIKLDDFNAFEVTVEIRQQIHAKLFRKVQKFISIEDCCSCDLVLAPV